MAATRQDNAKICTTFGGSEMESGFTATVVTGKCLCGAVAFQLSEPPLMIRSCWCRDCQYLSSGNASISAIFRSKSLQVTGTLGEFNSVSDAGNHMRRRFCAKCGTSLFSESLETPDYIAIRVGALDNREVGQPTCVIWTASAPSWGFIDHHATNFAGQPGPVGG
jgi:hypothetical protein